MKSKNNSEKNAKIKRQLISTGVYIALAAAVLGITSNSVKKILDGGEGYKLPENADIYDHQIKLPELDIPEEFDLPEQTEHEFPGNEEIVSETSEGVTAEVKEIKEEPGAEPDVTTKEESAVPQKSDLPPAVRVKPAAGYISREFSDDELIYTPTMNDFRTHSGIDITGDIGSPVCAFASGVVAEIRNDAFLGVTVVLEHSGGMVSSYSNLAENLPQEISVGAFVEVGQTIGGIGETAIIESADVPHVHFELYLNETCVNPEDYLS